MSKSLFPPRESDFGSNSSPALFRKWLWIASEAPSQDRRAVRGQRIRRLTLSMQAPSKVGAENRLGTLGIWQ